MENLKSYIESGILELYVLGDLSAEEKSDVEAMSKLHPEVKAELEEIEKAMLAVSMNFSMEPSAKVKENFFSALTFSDEEQSDVVVPTLNQNVEEAKVVPLTNNINFYKYSFAACLALLVVSVVAIISLSRSLKDSRQQIAQLQSSNQTFANQVNYLDKKVSSSNQTIEVLTNPEVKLVTLKGTDNAPKSNLVVAFNQKEQKVMLNMSNMRLPKTDEQHQYQLWALVDGKPVDLGVFDMDENSSGFVNMKPIGAAQTFAVTLEPRGGSATPTLEKLMVIGNI